MEFLSNTAYVLHSHYFYKNFKFSSNSILFFTFLIQKKEALGLWGYPQKISDIFDVFVQYCRGESVNALPWSDLALAEETNIIREQLAHINSLGYLTINSQPAVNGVRSDHKVFGWGPKNGYVYQKV